jgi:hypothetical protein
MEQQASGASHAKRADTVTDADVHRKIGWEGTKKKDDNLI